MKRPRPVKVSFCSSQNFAESPVDGISTENHANSSIYEINESEWNKRFFETLGFSMVRDKEIFESAEKFPKELMDKYKLSEYPYFVTLMIQISGNIPDNIQDKEQPLNNITKTNKDWLVITRYPFITDVWKTELNDYYFPSNKDNKQALKWVTLFVIGPFIELSTAILFHKAWLNNAQGQQTKITKCLSLVRSLNLFFKNPEVIAVAQNKPQPNQTTVPIQVFITPIELKNNFKVKDLLLPHMDSDKKEEEFKQHLLFLSEKFPSLKHEYEDFQKTDEFKWHKWSIVEDGDNSIILKPAHKNLCVLGDFV